MTVMIEKTAGLEIPTYDIMLDFDDVIMPWMMPVHEQCDLLGLTNGRMFSSWTPWVDYGCTKEQWLDAILSAQANGLYTDTDPFPGAVAAINELLWRGHRVHIVTARGTEWGTPTSREQIKQWTRMALAKHGIGHTTLTFRKNKPRAMDELGVHFDYAIDDGVHNYEALASRGVDVWMHTQPHNQAYNAVRRIDSLWNFAKMIHLDQTTTASLNNIQEAAL